jgi:choice-of-anchor B domain-containing protein
VFESLHHYPKLLAVGAIAVLAVLLALAPGLLAHDDEGSEPIDGPAAATAHCHDGSASGFACRSVDLVAHRPLQEIGEGTGNDVWGWEDPRTGREYVLVGRSTGTSFVDITDAENPRYLGDLPTEAEASAWRDIKVYGNHALVVADNAGPHGMQIFALKKLRRASKKPAELSPSAVYHGFGRAHNLVINEETGFAYAVGTDTCDGGLHMIDIRDPESPIFAGCFADDGYTHDAQCVLYHGPDNEHRSKEICFAANEDTLTIVDVSDKQAPVLLSRTAYSDVGYSHQGWLTEDHAYFLLDDELDERNFGLGTRTIVWDMRDLDSPRVAGEHSGPAGFIDHNQYVRGNHTFQANYEGGLRILELTDLANAGLSEVAFFDTFPESDGQAFAGAWSVYPYFRSGVTAVSDINRGLFLLRPRIGEPVFADDFERGNVLKWTNRKGSRVATVEPGLDGSGHALEVTLEGSERPSYVSSLHPLREESFVLSLRLSANRVDLGNQEVEFLRLIAKKKKPVALLTLEQRGGRYWVRLWASNGGTLELIGTTRIPAMKTVPLRLEWIRANGAADGVVRLNRKKKLKASSERLDNGRLRIDAVRVGLPAGSAGIEGSGSFLLDDYLSSEI